MSNILAVLGSKILEIILKKTKDGNKQQEIEVKKIDEYKKVLGIALCVALFMCVIASLFPSLAITSWWFNLVENLINNKL